VSHAVTTRQPLFLLSPPHRRAMAAFVAAVSLTTGALVSALVWTSVEDPFVFAHAARDWSTDLVAPIVYGGGWRFAALTRPVWSRLPDPVESSVHLGLTVLVLAAVAWRRRSVLGAPAIRVWATVAAVFLVLSLGPRLHAAGREIHGLLMPYGWLEAAFPPLRISGMPGRMMVMVFLAAGVLAAWGLAEVWRSSGRRRWLAAPLLALGVIEYLPGPIPATVLPVPSYVETLRTLPAGWGLVDTVSGATRSLYYQTMHDKPVAFGYVARIPLSVDAKDSELAQSLRRDDPPIWLRRYRIRYVLTDTVPESLRPLVPSGVVWSDGRVLLFDLARGSPATGWAKASSAAPR
jgi:hypothetical protein